MQSCSAWTEVFFVFQRLKLLDSMTLIIYNLFPAIIRCSSWARIGNFLFPWCNGCSSFGDTRKLISIYTVAYWIIKTISLSFLKWQSNIHTLGDTSHAVIAPLSRGEKGNCRSTSGSFSFLTQSFLLTCHVKKCDGMNALQKMCAAIPILTWCWASPLPMVDFSLHPTV